MRTPFRVLSAALLLLSLAACDRGNPLNPGVQDHTNNDSFARAPRAGRVDTDRDSITGGGKAYEPIGTGSAPGTPIKAPGSSTSAADDTATAKAVRRQGSR